MTDILTSIHGRKFGLDADGYATNPTGAKFPELWAGVSGSEVRVADPTITAGSTAANISASGITTLGSTDAASYTLSAPVAGNEKKLVCTAATTTIQTVTLESGTFDGTNNVASFDGDGEALHLQAVSTARWAILSNYGSVALSTA